MQIQFPPLDEKVISFAKSELSGDLAERDVAGEFSWEDWRKCAEFGFLRSMMPEEQGGTSRSVAETVAMFESLGYGCRDNGLTLALNAQFWTVQMPLIRFGSDKQVEQYLPGLMAGQLMVCDAISEVRAGSDVSGIETTATPCDGGYRLSGRKSYITMAGAADLALVIAKTDPAAGNWGMSCFLVETTSSGVSQRQDGGKLGLRTVPFGELILDECFVPEENRLGAEGSAMAIFQDTMDWERSFIQTSQVGGMAKMIERCVGYAREREQFGKPIASFQAVTNRISDMILRQESARLHLYRMAALKEAGVAAPKEAAMANLQISEACLANAEDAVRIHGARGFLREFGIERELRDAVGGVLYAGTSDIQRNIIARFLGLNP